VNDERDMPACGHDVRGCIQKFPDWVDNEITTIYSRWEATQRFMAPKLTRLTHKIAIQLHLVAEGSTIISSRSRRPVRKLLDAPSYFEVLFWHSPGGAQETYKTHAWQPFLDRDPNRLRAECVWDELLLCSVLLNICI